MGIAFPGTNLLAPALIEAKYESLGGPGGLLGNPVEDVKSTPDGEGAFRRYERGMIYWTFFTGAHEVHGAILDKWSSMGFERSLLGYPTQDEAGTPDGVGRFSSFQKGVIYWTPDTGAHEVHGAILAKWASMGFERSLLGYPIEDEGGTPDGRGRFSRFQHGMIYWTPNTGAHELHGAILDKWSAMGFERSFLGYPVSDQIRWRTTDPNKDQFIAWNLFENGAVVTTNAKTDVAQVAMIDPETLRQIIRKATDTAIHQSPDNFGLHPGIQSNIGSDWQFGSFIDSKRTITFTMHGFHDNGLIFGDTDFDFWFTLQFSLTQNPISFTDDWIRGLAIKVVPNSVGTNIGGISGLLVSIFDPDAVGEADSRIEKQINANVQLPKFPVTTAGTDGAVPAESVKLVILDVIVTADAGLAFLISPDAFGPDGSFQPMVQHQVDNFVNAFMGS